MRSVLFTDLDGTLLDHHTYRHDAASGWLKRLQAAGVPVVINTSKTFHEVRALQEALEISAPFGVENGGAIYYPPGTASHLPDSQEGWSCEVLGADADTLLAFLEANQSTLQNTPLSTLSDREIVQKTGLRPEQAASAKTRHYSQPFLIQGGDLLRFKERAAQAGLGLLQGGRFWHLVAAHQNKGEVLRRVTAHYTRRWGEAPKSIALGDSANDFAMLDAADIAVLVARPDGGHAPYERAACRRMEGIGPVGWAEAIEQLAKEGAIDA